MPATLQQIQAKLNEAIALRDDALQTQGLLALTAGGIEATTSQTLSAKLNGYQREVEVLMKCERDLIAHGRLDAETERLAESRFNAWEAISAPLSAGVDLSAQTAPREGPRSEASAAPLPASGDVF